MTREASIPWTEVMTLGREVILLAGMATVDARVAAVADAQQGIIGTGQLLACGLSASAARSRVATGRLHRLYRGVFTPGHPGLPPLGPVAAGVLACGIGASCSHLTAAGLRDLRSDGRALIDVATRSATGRRCGNVITHSARNLRSQDVSVVHGIPTTSVARTLLDCAPLLGQRGTEKLVAEAEQLRVFDLADVHDLLADVRGHRGRGVLRAAIGDAAAARGQTASRAEDDLLVGFRAVHMDEPECNPPVLLPGGDVVYPDFLWRDGALVVEADPRGTHDTTASYRSDRIRDRRLDAIGLQTMRFSDIELRQPRVCAVETRDRLAVRREQRHEFRPLDGRNS